MTQQVAQGHVKEVAERIGLAARSLPGCEIGKLVEGLVGKLGGPLTTEKLGSLTLKDLDQLFSASRDAPQREEMRQALHYLWGEGIGAAPPPTPLPYAEGDMPQSVRLAVASNTTENLDGHFGSCKRFLVYQVSCQEARLIEIRDPAPCVEADDPNTARAQMLADCQLLYVQSIGGPAAAKVIRAGIHPVKFPQGGPAQTSIERLQQTLQSPPPWLARVMGVTARSLSRYATEEDEAA
ncbi:nitrogen fixation protein NifX [Formivibrio citricus]|uniref:Nitrogen fixation protein NifX n=1 Tax=Formivibrio citricus TaxID=83765 RepID=A0A1I4Z158_9NEIS|nr:dinitrogenase iron-molybdenum cofactor biosynthesis protein [Formivibrio citricus]SFN43783.1 nitrogen fixation protein NifX [Formivibrio citricus]